MRGTHSSKRKPLTREEFREGVFTRDGHRCIICGAPLPEDFVTEATMVEWPGDETGEQGQPRASSATSLRGAPGPGAPLPILPAPHKWALSMIADVASSPFSPEPPPEPPPDSRQFRRAKHMDAYETR